MYPQEENRKRRETDTPNTAMFLQIREQYLCPSDGCELVADVAIQRALESFSNITISNTEYIINVPTELGLQLQVEMFSYGVNKQQTPFLHLGYMSFVVLAPL